MRARIEAERHRISVLARRTLWLLRQTGAGILLGVRRERRTSPRIVAAIAALGVRGDGRGERCR